MVNLTQFLQTQGCAIEGLQLNPTPQSRKRSIMYTFTLVASLVGGVITFYSQYQSRKERSWRRRLKGLDTDAPFDGDIRESMREDLMHIVILLNGILVMLGVIADRLH
jgi:hypothetical protein